MSNDPMNGLNRLRQQQDILHAIIGGTAAAIVSAFVWAFITVLTHYQIGYMAIAIGFLVGFAVQYFGAGIDQKYGMIGALLALLGCVLGNLLSQIAFVAEEESIGYWEIISLLNFDIIISIYKESFSPMDVLFYGIAAYEGYRFAFRPITEELLSKASVNELPPLPYANLRLPIIITLFVIISFAGYFLMTD